MESSLLLEYFTSVLLLNLVNSHQRLEVVLNLLLLVTFISAQELDFKWNPSQLTLDIYAQIGGPGFGIAIPRHVKDTNSLLRRHRLDPNSTNVGQFTVSAAVVKYD